MADAIQSDARAARLAAALRANLARRKARDREVPPPTPDFHLRESGHPSHTAEDESPLARG